jgi:hypothetical protein
MGRKIAAVVVGCAFLVGIWTYFHRPEPKPRLVSAIEVVSGDHRQIYQDQEQMSWILNKLRTLGQRYAPDRDPDTLNESTVMIRIIHSDGSCQEYELKADRYIRQDQSKWQQADPKRIQALMLLLKKSNALLANTASAVV